MASPDGISVLVFDGENIEDAGVLASLDTFEELTSRYSYDKNPDEDPGSSRPCEYFDLIVGSGHGGFLALMFGRMGMQVSSVKKAYGEFHSSIHLAQADPERRGNDLESFLQNLIREELGTDDPSDHLLIPGTSAPVMKCRTAVLASTPDDLSFPTTFRTYRVRDNKTANCSILHAIRASTATAGRLPAVVINEETFESASSLGHRYPVEIALMEAEVAFPGRPLRCKVSIGSGHPGYISHLKDDELSTERAQIHLASDPILRSHMVAVRLARVGQDGLYFRFDVEQGLQLQSCSTGNIAGRVRTHTRQYLKMAETGKRLNKALKSLKGELPKRSGESNVPVSQEPAPPTEELHISSVPPIETYMHELYAEGHGLPLWDPEPQGASPLSTSAVSKINT
ncbi:hypothetical protein DL96DRAFT_262066 [Flagelloscypha sp. PMI_526]|nr:hypothetical protein DL96DRAFT_262066 [Flagelloscypha sp. PMI_526]